MFLLDDKNLVVTETTGTSRALSSPVSLPVQETMLSSIDLQSDRRLGGAEVAASQSTAAKELVTAADRPETGLPAMSPIRFDESGGGGRCDGRQTDVAGIRLELDALPAYHRNVRNCSSSVCRRCDVRLVSPPSKT